MFNYDSLQPRQHLKELVHGYNLSCAINVAIKLGLAEMVCDGVCSVVALAEKTGTLPDRLKRLLALLQRAGIFTLNGDGGVAHTSLSLFLDRKHPQSIAREALLFGGDETYHAWSQLEASLREEKTAFATAFGKDFYSYLEEHPEIAARFQCGWAEISTQVGFALAAAIDSTSFACVTDVGGGRGAVLAEVLARHQHLCGIVYDQGSCLREAPELMIQRGVEARCTYIVGSALEKVPSGSDLHILKSVLHGYADADCVRILRNCASSLASGGSICVIERILPATGEQCNWAVVVDVAMMVMTGGEERTQEQFSTLIDQAGLRLAMVQELAGGFFAIWATK